MSEICFCALVNIVFNRNPLIVLIADFLADRTGRQYPMQLFDLNLQTDNPFGHIEAGFKLVRIERLIDKTK